MDIDIEKVKRYCVVQLENENGLLKWYSIGLKTINIKGEEVQQLSEDCKFSLSLLNKNVNDYANFGHGFKIISIIFNSCGFY